MIQNFKNFSISFEVLNNSIFYFHEELGYNRKVDVWSAGCIMFEVYTGVTMFKVIFITSKIYSIKFIMFLILFKTTQYVGAASNIAFSQIFLKISIILVF